MYELVLQFLTQIFGLMYSVLTEDLSDFSPHAYEYISILNTILKGFASSLMLVAFCVGYIQSAVSLIEQKTPIAVFKTLARDRQCSGGTRYGYNPHADVLCCPQLNKPTD